MRTWTSSSSTGRMEPAGAYRHLHRKGDSTGTIVRQESKLDYQFIPLLENFPADFDLNNSALWSGELEAPRRPLPVFLHYAGYIRVFMDNEPVVEERWRTAWNPNSYKFEYHLKEGERVPIRVEWEPDGDVSYIALKALSPVPEEEQNKLSLWSEMGNGIDYYFVAGNSMDEVISGYRTLTGKSQIMPKWAMGFWQSRERYKTQDELLETLAEFRKREIPIDNIVQDWSYWPEAEWGSHKFDKERFPDPKGMVDKIHEMNARIMISVWPKFYMNTDHYKAFDKNGWMYQQAVKTVSVIGSDKGISAHSMTHMPKVHANYSGNSSKKTYIHWVSMPGGWMLPNRTSRIIPTWITGRSCAAPLPSALPQNTSTPIRW